MTGKVSIRWSLIRSFIAITAMLSILLLVATIIIGQRTAERASMAYLKQTRDLADAAVREFVGPVSLAFGTTEKAFRGGLLDPDTPATLDTYFAAFMARIPHLTSVNTGDEQGNGYMLLQTADGWKSRRVKPAEMAPDTVEWRDLDTHMNVLSTRVESLDYDPRKRPWYTGARQSADGPPHTSPPYRFKTTKEIGITMSKVISQKSGTDLVVAFDILSRDISAFSSSIRPSPNGKIVVFLEDGRVTGLPAGMDITDPKKRRALLLQPISDLQIPEVTAAFEKWKATNRSDPSAFKIKSNGEHWWCYLHKLSLRQEQPSWMLSMVPERDIMGDVNLMMLLILIITVIVVLFAIATSMILSRKLSRPIHDLVEQSAALRRLETNSTTQPNTSIIEILELSDVNERMRVALDAFARYIPTDVVKQLLDKGEAAKLGGRTEQLTILFTDIADFTRISESMAPQDLVLHLAPYFEEVLDELQGGRATVDKFIGDAIVAFWGAPTADPDHQERAIATIWRCHQVIQRLNEKAEQAGKPPFVTRFGVTYGEAVVGNVGAPNRLNYTILGDRVNLAARLEGTNKKYGTSILVADPIPELTSHAFVFRKVDVVAVKGKSEGTAIYELMGPMEEVGDEQRQFKLRYETAWQCYADQQFDAAIERLDTLSKDYPDDISIQRLKDRCLAYKQTPPAGDWIGVTPLNSK